MPYSRDLPHPRTKPTSLMSPALARGFFITNATWEALGQRQNCSVWPPGCVLWPFPLWLHFVPHPPHTLLSLPPSCPLSLCLISTLPLPYVLVSFSPAYTTLFSSAPGLLHMLPSVCNAHTCYNLQLLMSLLDSFLSLLPGSKLGPSSNLFNCSSSTFCPARSLLSISF